jgi:hypothetical protein
LTILIQKLYEKKGRTLGDKKYFGSFFIIWSVSIFLIISVIKSSVVLSLGMVGALSIVRFRNAIKDTEQIMYLLFLIGISMSLASNQYLYTIVIGGFLLAYIYLRDLKTINTTHSQFLFISFTDPQLTNDLIKLACDKKNQIISIQKSDQTTQIVATFNNYSQFEIQEFCQILDTQKISYRINQNYYV